MLYDQLYETKIFIYFIHYCLLKTFISPCSDNKAPLALQMTTERQLPVSKENHKTSKPLLVYHFNCLNRFRAYQLSLVTD